MSIQVFILDKTISLVYKVFSMRTRRSAYLISPTSMNIRMNDPVGCSGYKENGKQSASRFTRTTMNEFNLFVYFKNLINLACARFKISLKILVAQNRFYKRTLPEFMINRAYPLFMFIGVLYRLLHNFNLMMSK